MILSKDNGRASCFSSSLVVPVFCFTKLTKGNHVQYQLVFRVFFKHFFWCMCTYVYGCMHQIAQVVRTTCAVADFSHSTVRVLKMALKNVGLGRKCLHPQSRTVGPRGFKGPNTLAILLSHSSSWCTHCSFPGTLHRL